MSKTITLSTEEVSDLLKAMRHRKDRSSLVTESEMRRLSARLGTPAVDRLIAHLSDHRRARREALIVELRERRRVVEERGS